MSSSELSCFAVKEWKCKEDVMSVCNSWFSFVSGRGASLAEEEPMLLQMVQETCEEDICLVVVVDDRDDGVSLEYCQEFFHSMREVILHELDAEGSRRALKRLTGCYRWDLTDFPGVRENLKKEDHQPLLLVLGGGEVKDIFYCCHVPVHLSPPAPSLPSLDPSGTSNNRFGVSRDACSHSMLDGVSCVSDSSSRYTYRCMVPLLESDVLRGLCERLGAPTVASVPCGVQGGDSNIKASDAVASFAASSLSPTKVSETSAGLVINIASWIEIGRKTMQQGKAVYAEKIFLKALSVADEMVSETLEHLVDPSFEAAVAAGSFDDLLRAQALVLAWVAIAQMVQGKHGVTNNQKNSQTLIHETGWVSNPFVSRLEEKKRLFFSLLQEPKNEVLRAISLNKLLAVAFVTPIFIPKNSSLVSSEAPSDSPSLGPSSHEKDDDNDNEHGEYVEGVRWSSGDPSCSQTWLRKYLAQHPTDVARRRQLLITLFLADDLEACFTEVLKLESLGDRSFASAAFSILADFYGKDDPLIATLAKHKWHR